MQDPSDTTQQPARPSGSGLDALLPRAFGKYTLLRSLAKGGMAEVYLALQRAVAGFEKLVVIKRILPELARDRSFVEMLLHEARVAATLSHPNIVQTFDVGETGGTYFIAMEYINGEDIRSVVRAMKRLSMTEFPLEHALSIVLGVCAGLAYAHDKRDLEGKPLGLVHRDISPQNILITYDGDVKVVDFGIAKSAQIAAAERASQGQLKGKVPYMSPEQAAGKAIDHRSDIFAVGIVLFELSTGRRLFKAASEHETIKLICERTYPRPSQVRPNYPPALERIVMRALERDVSKRYATARELHADLENFIRLERVAASSVKLGSWMNLLFTDKIEQQKAALQDAKQLADVIAAQIPPPSESMVSLTATGLSLPLPGVNFGDVTGTGTGISQHSRVRSGAMGRWLAIGGAVVALIAIAVVLGFVFGPFRGTAQAPTTATPAPTEPVAAATQKGKLSLVTHPEGCDVWLNGELQPAVTPTALENLPIEREMELKVTKEGFESFVEKVTLSPEDAERSIEIKMVRGSVTLVIDVTPVPVVFIDGKKWEGTGSKIEGMSAGEHKIVVSAAGHVPQTFTFVAKKGETKTIEAQLQKGDGKPGGSAGTATSSSGDDKPKATGKVNVAAKGGYCDAFVNGRGVGPTPVGGIVVPEGPVSVTCKTPDGKTLGGGGMVKAGETTRITIVIPK